MAFIDLNEMMHPFYEVAVAPPNPQPDDFLPLPEDLKRIIAAVEYTEAIDGGRGSAARIRITFYDNIQQSTAVLDRTITGEKGKAHISYLSAKQVSEGKKIESQIEAEETALGQMVIPDSDNKNVVDTATASREAKKKAIQDLKAQLADTSSLFLFQERNFIKLTFGYRNAKHGQLQSRTVIGEILQVNYRAAEGSIPLTEILAVDVGNGEMSKLYCAKGVNFNNELIKKLIKSPHVPKGINKQDAKGNSAVLKDKELPFRGDTEPARIDDIVQGVADSMIKNCGAIINLTPQELFLDLQDAGSARTWAMGTNLHDFLLQLAEKIYANYYVTTELKYDKISKKKILKTYLHLISRRIWDEQRKFHFMWKSGLGSTTRVTDESKGTIFNTVKSFDLSLYPGGGSGASSYGVSTESKKAVGSIANVDQRFSLMYQEGADPKELNFNNATTKSNAQKQNDRDQDNAINLSALGMPLYSASNSDNQHDATANKYAGRMSKGLRISFISIGIPQLKPGIVKVSNIGIRYSGDYSLLSVTHKFSDSDGYTCNCVGESNVVHGGGVTVKEAPVRNDLAEESRFKVRYEEGETAKEIPSTEQKVTKK